MRHIRTDLAMESFQAAGRDEIPGVKVNHWETMGVTVTEVIIEDEDAGRQIGKAAGNYLTLECPGIRQRDIDSRLAMSNLLGEEIARMIRREGDRPVLVVGLGNRNITPDSLGPKAVDKTLVTRHMFREIPEYADKRMRSVCAIAPGVLGVTGIETMEVIESLVKCLNPQSIVCIDALSARAADRICSTVQLTDTGIHPGSGVGNHRRALTKESLGVPVIALGIPTVIYAATLARDAMELISTDRNVDGAALDDIERELLKADIGDMIVTPREIDDLITDAAGIVAAAVNRALQPELSEEEILSLMD
ncbi:MAG: GPR endopeptidase [Clostridiales bacterium]|nr:GPR endopeptidase [Clostridiales bacterium]